VKAIISNVEIDLAERLFEQLDHATRRGRGIVRDSYGAGEQAAHDIVRAAGEQLGLEVCIDAIGNLTLTLPGKDRSAPRILIGSHLDSSPQAGNFDGAAGVVAGLCALAALCKVGFVPECDVGVIAIRAEESSWFDISYLGSAGALGLLDPRCLSVRRSDNGRTLEETLMECGFDAGAIRERRRLLDPGQVRAYLELHIEQGPRLVAEGLPAAVVTGIRGCKRFRHALCLGEYGHSGALPRTLRHDAVAATVAFLHHMEGVWLRAEKEGIDLLLTTGELYTDSVGHAPSKVAGKVRFVLDLRSMSEDVMEAIAAEARRAADEVGRHYRVSFDLGAATDSPPALMDSRLRSCLLGLLERPLEIPSGAGHDAAVFANAGIPSAMIFVRNDHGSHNPEETMALEDFAVGTRALIGLLQQFPL
jgi:beta-ureidopropionase / N-carbamoyl-L-amino-acid hydrolase